MTFVSRSRLLAVLATLALGAGLTASAGPASAVAPRDTGLLAFVRANQIYTSTTTGTGVTRLTTAGKNYRPHWSPDGHRIAYVHEQPGNVRDIWVMNADGSHKHQVTHLGDTTEPTWSPDGKWLAYGANGTPPYQSFQNDGRLQKIRSTAPFGNPIVFPGNGDEQLDPFVDGTLAWSPDGTRIVYASEFFPSSPDHYLLVYTIATKDVELIADVGGSCCGEGFLQEPTWTPDSAGVALSYLVYGEEDPPPPGPHIAILTGLGPPTGGFPDIPGDHDPDYSPTGTKVVFSHYSRIYVSDANGAHRKDLLKGYYPDWQPTFD